MPEIKYKWFQDGGFIIRYRPLYDDFEMVEIPQFGGDEIQIGLFTTIEDAKRYADNIC